MSAAVLRCGPALVAVRGDSALLGELRAACRPWITSDPTSPTPPGAWTVGIDADLTGETVASRTGAAVRITPGQRTLHLGPPAPPQGVRPLVRLLRALIRRQLAACGEVFLDAAVLTLAGRGIALVGGACAGKTSTLIAALYRHHGHLVANDDTSLHLSHGQVFARGYPRAIEVRRDTMPHLGGAAPLLVAAAEVDSPARALYLQPHRLATALGAQLADATELSALVLLGRGERPALHRLSPDAAAAAVAAHLAPADPYESWLEPHLPTPTPEAQQATGLARALPLWRLTQPLTALDESADLLADLTACPGGPQ